MSPSIRKITARAAGFAAVALLAGCTSAPFSYAEDRCLGGHNQCRTQCISIDAGPARSACEQRCLMREDRCYVSGDDGTGSSLAQESLIGAARSEAEKEAAFEEWKRRRERERDAAAEIEDMEPAVTEILE